MTICRLESTTGIIAACSPTLQPLYHFFSSKGRLKEYLRKRQERRAHVKNGIDGNRRTDLQETYPVHLQYHKSELDNIETARAEMGAAERSAELDFVDAARYVTAELPTVSLTVRTGVPLQKIPDHTSSFVKELPADWLVWPRSMSMEYHQANRNGNVTNSFHSAFGWYGFLPQHGITAYQLSTFCLIINTLFTQGRD